MDQKSLRASGGLPAALWVLPRPGPLTLPRAGWPMHGVPAVTCGRRVFLSGSPWLARVGQRCCHCPHPFSRSCPVCPGPPCSSHSLSYSVLDMEHSLSCASHMSLGVNLPEGSSLEGTSRCCCGDGGFVPDQPGEEIGGHTHSKPCPRLSPNLDVVWAWQLRSPSRGRSRRGSLPAFWKVSGWDQGLVFGSDCLHHHRSFP